MAEGKEVVEEQMETASAGEECQKEGEQGDVSSDDDDTSDSSSDTEDEGKLSSIMAAATAVPLTLPRESALFPRSVLPTLV